nr:RecName: Full=Rubusin [Rubus idaeus]
AVTSSVADTTTVVRDDF